MKQSVRNKTVVVVDWMTGLCAVAGLIVSFRGLYGMLQVWAGKITSVPFIGELTYPRDAESGTGTLLSFFEVVLGGLEYAFMWFMPAGFAVVVLCFVSDRLSKN